MATSKQDIPTNIRPCKKIALVSGCTMKEYDQLISDLKKENFNLKLRIYYTEEKLQKTFGDDHDVLKLNVQLQTEIDSLKQELINKQVLIQKATLAIETLTADRDKAEETIRNRLRTDFEKELTQLRDQLDKANQSRDKSHSEVEKARKEVEMLKQHLNDTTKDLAASCKINEDLEKTLEEMKLEQRQKDTLLDRYKKSVEGLMKTLQQRNQEFEDLRIKIDEGSEQIHVLQTELKESQLQNTKLLDNSSKQLHGVKILMDFLGKEMKSLAFCSQQCKDDTGEDTNTKAWSIEASSVQRVYQELQKLAENNIQPQQTLMYSVQARQEHSDSVDNITHHDLEPVFKTPESGQLSSFQGKELTGPEALQETFAETGHSSAEFGVVSTPGNVKGISPIDSNVLNKVNTNNVDSFLQSDIILSSINWWLQTPDRLEDERAEKLVLVNINGNVNHVQKPQSDQTGENSGTNISSMDLHKEFRRDDPEGSIPSVDKVEDLKKNDVQMVSGVASSEDLRKGNQEKRNVPSLDSHEELKDNTVGSLRTGSEVVSVGTSIVIIHPVASPDRSLAADSKEGLFGTYSESLDNFHKFQHATFFEEDQFDIRRHDRASSGKFDSQNATLTGRTVSEQMISTGSSHWSSGESNHNSSRESDTGSVSQVGEAENRRHRTQKPAAVDQNIIDGRQLSEINQNIIDGQQLSEIHQNIIGDQQPVSGDKNTFHGQQNQNIFDNQQLMDVNQNMLGCQENANDKANTQIKDLEEKLKATENTVKLLSRKNKVYLSALKAAGVCVNFMNRSSSESCLGSPSASSGKRASSEGSLSMTSRQGNDSIEKPRSFICDTLNQTGDVTSGCLDASIVATPSRTSASLVDDASRISEMHTDFLNHTSQSCATDVNPAVSQTGSTPVSDHVSNTNNNNHNSSFVGNSSASFCTIPASPPASLSGSMRASPQKQPHDVSLSSEKHQPAALIPNCLDQSGVQNQMSLDRHDKSHESEDLEKSGLNMTGVSEKGPIEVTYSSILDQSWKTHRASLDGGQAGQDRYPDVTYSSVVDSSLINLGVKSGVGVATQSRHPDLSDLSVADKTLTNHGVKSTMDTSGISQAMHPDVTYSSFVDKTVNSPGNKSSIDKSEVSRGRSPDVTFSSIMDGSLMNRLLNNLEHSLSALKDDTWNVSDLSVEQLRHHVEHLERVNLALKEEIRVYETLHCLQTTQAHPSDKSSHQKDQELCEENLKSCSKSKSQMLSEEDLLRQYLIEIRKIRQRLERLDLVKDPDQLLIFQSHTHQRIVHQETVIAHLQQLMAEKETQWQQEISELQHKLSREKVLAVEKLEASISQLQTTVRDQTETVREQEKQIVGLKICLEQSERNMKHKEEGMGKGGMSDLEAQVMIQKASGVDEGQRLDKELEAKQKEIEMLTVELGKEKESWRRLKEIVVKREKSLQEKILALEKMTNEKAVVEDAFKTKEVEVKMFELEFEDLREKLQGMEAALEQRAMLVKQVESLKEELSERENQEVRFDFQKMRYDAEIEKITEEKVKLSLDLETASREKEALKLHVGELERKVSEKVKLERQNTELKGEIKSLLNEVDKLNTKLSCRVVQEMEMRNRLRIQGETESQVVCLLREQLLKCEENFRKAEQLRDGAVGEVKEREERLKKRNEQLHHLLGQYKKMEAAFLQQRSKLKEKTELLQKLKKQIHLHEHNLTGSSDHSLNETDHMLDSKNYPESTFTSTPITSPPVRQPSESAAVKQCRRQLTYSAAESQHSEAKLITSASDTSCPVAVLTQDCHHKLRGKTEECLLIVTEIESRLGHRLAALHKTEYDSEKKDYSFLRETYVSCQRLDNCLRETASWISAMQETEIPGSKIQAPNDPLVMSQQKENPRNEIQELPSHATTPQSLTQQQNKLYKNHMTWEKTLYKQLFKTTQDLEQAKGNINATLTSLPPH